jgi:C-terminal processing protease CtpA/Prc
MKVSRIILSALACALAAPAAMQAQQVEIRVAHRGLLGIFTESQRVGEQRRPVVIEVAPGSPAADAGIRKGDVILTINGAAATDQLLRAGATPGDTVIMRVLRDGVEHDHTLIVAERPASGVFFARPVLSDSVLREIAVIMNNVRTEVDTIVFEGRARSVPGVSRLEARGNVVIAFGGDSIHVRRLEGDSLSVFRFSERSWGPADSTRIRLFSRGDSVRTEMIEALRSRTYTISADSMRGSFRPAEVFTSGMVIGMRAVAGAELSELNPDLAAYFGVSGGVLVLNAGEGTPAERAGMRAGDVIVQANQTPVSTIAEIRRAIERSPRTPVQLRVLRRGQPIDITISRE